MNECRSISPSELISLIRVYDKNADRKGFTCSMRGVIAIYLSVCQHQFKHGKRKASWADLVPPCAQEHGASNTTFRWSIGHHLAKLHPCEFCKALEYLYVIQYSYSSPSRPGMHAKFMKLMCSLSPPGLRHLCTKAVWIINFVFNLIYIYFLAYFDPIILLLYNEKEQYSGWPNK